jgi:hypothetical protein
MDTPDLIRGDGGAWGKAWMDSNLVRAKAAEEAECAGKNRG